MFGLRLEEYPGTSVAHKGRERCSTQHVVRCAKESAEKGRNHSGFPPEAEYTVSGRKRR